MVRRARRRMVLKNARSSPSIAPSRSRRRSRSPATDRRGRSGRRDGGAYRAGDARRRPEGPDRHPGLIDGHAHMDREGLRGVFPSLGRVRSIGDIQDRIAELARSKKPGEWIVTMPIGDPPYYFDVPDILAEKRWPTRQELDARRRTIRSTSARSGASGAAPLPLVSCANTEALRRAGITRDTVSPRRDVRRSKGMRNGDPTGVFIERRDAADRGADLVPQRRRIHPRGPGSRPCRGGARLSRLRHHQRVRGPRRRRRGAARLQGSATAAAR